LPRRARTRIFCRAQLKIFLQLSSASISRRCVNLPINFCEMRQGSGNYFRSISKRKSKFEFLFADESFIRTQKDSDNAELRFCCHDDGPQTS
jgi:hypothetical protein